MIDYKKNSFSIYDISEFVDTVGIISNKIVLKNLGAFYYIKRSILLFLNPKTKRIIRDIDLNIAREVLEDSGYEIESVRESQKDQEDVAELSNFKRNIMLGLIRKIEEHDAFNS